MKNSRQTVKSPLLFEQWSASCLYASLYFTLDPTPHLAPLRALIGSVAIFCQLEAMMMMTVIAIVGTCGCQSEPGEVSQHAVMPAVTPVTALSPLSRTATMRSLPELHRGLFSRGSIPLCGLLGNYQPRFVVVFCFAF